MLDRPPGSLPELDAAFSIVTKQLVTSAVKDAAGVTRLASGGDDTFAPAQLVASCQKARRTMSNVLLDRRKVTATRTRAACSMALCEPVAATFALLAEIASARARAVPSISCAQSSFAPCATAGAWAPQDRQVPRARPPSHVCARRATAARGRPRFRARIAERPRAGCPRHAAPRADRVVARARRAGAHARSLRARLCFPCDRRPDRWARRDRLPRGLPRGDSPPTPASIGRLGS